MSPYSRPAPRGFRWADTPAMRAVLVVLIVFSLGLSIYASVRYVGLVNCLQDRATADGKRTAAIAVATDAERRADRALLAAPIGTPQIATLRAEALAARDRTDRVRAAFPASGNATRECG